MGECGCISITPDEYAAFHHDEIRKARKSHKCGECNREIKPGEKYEHVTGKWHEVISIQKTCLDCKSIRDVFFCKGWEFQMVWEHMAEHIDWMDGKVLCDGVSDLTPDAREKLFELIESYWARHPMDEDEE